jgi:hypothetical protein
MDEARRPVFWRWGDPITVRNEIRERWEAGQPKAQPMTEEAKARCAEVRREQQARRKLRRRGR